MSKCIKLVTGVYRQTKSDNIRCKGREQPNNLENVLAVTKQAKML